MLASEPLLKAIQIVAIILGPLAFGLAAADFALDFEGAVARALARNFNAQTVIGTDGAAEPTKRVELFGIRAGFRAALATVRGALALLRIARGFLGKGLRPLAQTVERPRLSVDGVVQVTLADAVAGRSHFAFGIAQRIGGTGGIEVAEHSVEFTAQALLPAL
jgi:hypothetical protein